MTQNFTIPFGLAGKFLQMTPQMASYLDEILYFFFINSSYEATDDHS